MLVTFNSCSSNKLKNAAPDSRALQILKAANINDNLEDTEVSDELYANIVTNNNLDFASNPTTYPRIPENPACTLVTDPTTACWVISSRLPSSRSRFFAWIPMHGTYKLSAQVMLSVLSDAVKKAAASVYPNAEVSTDINRPSKFTLKVANDDIENVWIVDFNIDEQLKPRKPPKFLRKSQYPSFIETSRNTKDNEGIKLTYQNQDPTNFFIALSQYLPAWAFIYLAPNMKPGEKVPLVLNQGKIHYLIKQKQ